LPYEVLLQGQLTQAPAADSIKTDQEIDAENALREAAEELSRAGAVDDGNFAPQPGQQRGRGGGGGRGRGARRGRGRGSGRGESSASSSALFLVVDIAGVV